ncbi:putative serine protease [Podospora conica]|nr:putative serine protease [Schizothecium conicum]
MYQESWIEMPIDHFPNDTTYEPHTNETFHVRYWMDNTHFRPGGPVILLQGGETSGVNRLRTLHQGIVKILIEATGGVGVLFEHRYYGKSLPTPDYSTKNLRFLTTDQAMADMAYFAARIKEESPSVVGPVPIIAYGGSYGGGLAAFVRKAYPDLFWGAISSSGVTEAIWDYWEYNEAPRISGPKDCVEVTQQLTHFIDTILITNSSTDLPHRLKTAFGLGNLTQAADFASIVSNGIAGLQSVNWDPALNSTSFGDYCAMLTSPSLVYPSTARLRDEAHSLLTSAGHPAALTTPLLNKIGYVNSKTSDCNTTIPGITQDSCFGASDPSFYAQDDLDQAGWRLFHYQECTEWGYFFTGSGVPTSQLPLVSRLLTLDYLSIVCREAFNISAPPRVERVNKFGGFNISFPRLALVGGERDPWRAATPHKIGLPKRKNTVDQPFILIEGAVHHWDENGVPDEQKGPGMPPGPVLAAQNSEVEFVKAWMAEWRTEQARHGGS